MAEKLHHIGFIVDGNRRWARERGLPTLKGHERGFEKVELLVDYLKTQGIDFVSFYLFSTENWNRSPEEINYLMKLVDVRFSQLAKKCQDQNLRIMVLGRPEPVAPKIWQKMLDAETQTATNTGMTICICFNYGGHWEIADAATRAIAAGETELTPDSFAKYLYHPEVPSCDLIVRTSGEQRISGFQLWRAAYAEFLFLEKNFPDLKTEDCEMILREYAGRQRRFGK